MKQLIIISIIALFASVVSTAQTYPDEYLGLPGDNLNLYATMKLFQESETLEAFERSLNDQNLNINNLDLNGDNLVDYIAVMDYVDGNVHTIVLRTALNRDETQDIAVFTVQRFDDGSVWIQLIGDEALYGKNYIVEPIYADSRETPNPGYIGNSTVVETPAVVSVSTYEVAAWPIIRFIFLPSYVCWRSFWTWGYYPSYWNPWRPYYWHTYYGYHTHYHHYYYGHYRRWNHCRYHRYNDFYYGHVRTYSPGIHVRIKEGNYRSTYSRPDLQKRGDMLYSSAARRNTDTRFKSSESRSRTSSTQSIRNGSGTNTTSHSGRRSVSFNPTKTEINSSMNKRTGDTRKSTTIQSGRTTTNYYQGANKGLSQKKINRSITPDRTSTISSTNKNRVISPKSTTITNSRTSRSSSVRQNNSQPKRSSSSYSTKSTYKPKVSSRSSSSRSSSHQTKTSVRSSSSSSRNSKATNRSSQSRSSSSGRSGRR